MATILEARNYTNSAGKPADSLRRWPEKHGPRKFSAGRLHFPNALRLLPTVRMRLLRRCRARRRGRTLLRLWMGLLLWHRTRLLLLWMRLLLWHRPGLGLRHWTRLKLLLRHRMRLRLRCWVRLLLRHRPWLSRLLWQRTLLKLRRRMWLLRSRMLLLLRSRMGLSGPGRIHRLCVHRCRQRPGRSNRHRPAVVVRKVLRRILPRRFNMLLLHRRRSYVLFSGVLLFHRRRLVLNSARSTRIRNMVVVDDRRVVNDRLVDVRVVNNRRIYVHHGRIVGKLVTAPLTTGESDPHIPKAVVHTTVVSNVRSPIAIKEAILTALKAPVRWRPKEARLRCRHPRARNPVITIFAVSPVAGRP